MLSALRHKKDNYYTIGLKWGKNETFLEQKFGKSGKNTLQYLDILRLKVGQSEDISWLKTGQHAELRIYLTENIFY